MFAICLKNKSLATLLCRYIFRNQFVKTNKQKTSNWKEKLSKNIDIQSTQENTNSS